MEEGAKSPSGAAAGGGRHELGNVATNTQAGVDDSHFSPASPTPTWAPLQELVDACRLVFTDARIPPTDDDISFVSGFMDKIGMNDVGLMDEARYFYIMSMRQGPPMLTCKIIYECANFRVMVVYLPKGVAMPIHNHPSMTVIRKLLVGSAHIEAYNFVSPSVSAAGSGSVMLAEKVIDQDVMAPSRASVQSRDYMHSFMAGQDGPCCVFLQVHVTLNLPAVQRCGAFPNKFHPNIVSREVTEEQKSRLVRLRKIDEPKDVKVVQLSYKVPPIV